MSAACKSKLALAPIFDVKIKIKRVILKEWLKNILKVCLIFIIRNSILLIVPTHKAVVTSLQLIMKYSRWKMHQCISLLHQGRHEEDQIPQCLKILKPKKCRNEFPNGQCGRRSNKHTCFMVLFRCISAALSSR